MNDRDALIVGAGPAGTTAAILLARLGARVTIVDRARFPREKLCGEFVSPEAVRILDRVGVLPVLRGSAGRTTAVLLTNSAGRSVRLPLPPASPFRPEALGISRREMDAALVEQAHRAGAEVIEGFEGARPLLSEGRVTGIVGRERASGRELSLRARFTLAADGRDSTLARALAPAAHRRRSSPMFGIKAHYRKVSGIGDAVELHYFRGGYVGLHRVGPDRVNVCSLIDRSAAGEIPKDPDRVVQEVFFRNAAVCARLEGAERVTDWLAVGSLIFQAEAPVRAGVLFLGDAAGTIDPFAGEGMSMAFRSGEIASEVLARALGGAGGAERRAQDADGSVGSTYASRWRREFALRIAICRAIGRLTIRPAVQLSTTALLRAFPLAGRLLLRGTRAGVALRPPDAASA